ncbi:MAG: methyltransferase domain-containing protein [Planctomycetota bacterium]|nr:methyltransferase domain-containing protein [Planctomycetota bacterium]
MSSQAPRIAHGILCRAERDKVFPERAMAHRLKKPGLDAAERARVREIVHGVLRNRLQLDHILGKLSDIPLRDLERSVIWALRIGAHRVLRHRGAPTPVAVKETVDLLPNRKGPRGFANAVLRALAGSVEDRLPEVNPVPPGGRDLPFPDGSGLRFNRSLLPDSKSDLAAFLSVAYSHPIWIVRRWLGYLGEEPTVDALRAGCGPAPFSIRTNRLRISREQLLERLKGSGFDVEAGGPPEAIRIRQGRAILESPEFAAGLFYVQDETPMQVVPFLDPKPGLRCLDLCASPGGKTTHLAELMENQGEILAWDISEGKLERIEENCRRLGSSIVSTARIDPQEETLPSPGTFDRVLLDVPCSNSGVFRRRPEARLRLGPDSLKKLRDQQAALLEKALPLLAPGGTLVYSTCSLEPEENREVLAEFLERHAEIILREDRFVLPRPDGPDGGYMARLESGT